MKKVFLLVAVFLIGNATQALANQKRDVVINPGQKHRYYKSQTIRFVENGVLYSVATDGTFDFKLLTRPRVYTQGRRGGRQNYTPVSNFGVQYVKYGRRNGRFIKTDRYGIIRSIGNTPIIYKQNGKVRSIGSVAMKYHRGRVVLIGNMQIIYNRFGKIRDTFGSINRFNSKIWHDDWLTCNDQSHQHNIYGRYDLDDNGRDHDWDDFENDGRRGHRKIK